MRDFRYRFRNGGEFSAKDNGFLVVESLELPRKGDLSRLELSLHVEFICTVLEMNQKQCFWLVESPSDHTLEDLTGIFPNHYTLNGSVMGYFDFNRELIARFWTAFETADKTEPWKNEESWALGNVTANLPIPKSDSPIQRPYWSVEHILKNCQKINALFVQSGWFAFFAIRPFEQARTLLEREFPELKTQPPSKPPSA
jgi:hypothetical protein